MVPNQFWENHLIDLGLNLVVHPSAPEPGELLVSTTFTGQVSGGALLALVGVAGAPTFSILDIGSFDGTGEYQVVWPVIPGLAGLEVDFQAFGIGEGGQVESTPIRGVTFL